MNPYSTLCVLLLVSTGAQAGRYDSYEMRNAKQEFCGKAGDLAVAARTHPDVARQKLTEFQAGKSDTALAWAEAINTGLQAGPGPTDRDLFMRGWSACMDVMKHR